MSPRTPRLIPEVLITTPRPPASSASRRPAPITDDTPDDADAPDDGDAADDADDLDDGPSSRTRAKGDKKSRSQPVPTPAELLQPAPAHCSNCKKEKECLVLINPDTNRQSCERCHLRKKRCSFTPERKRKTLPRKAAVAAVSKLAAADDDDPIEEEVVENNSKDRIVVDNEPDHDDPAPPASAEPSFIDPIPLTQNTASSSRLPAGPSDKGKGKRPATRSPTPPTPSPSARRTDTVVLFAAGTKSSKRIRTEETRYDRGTFPHVNAMTGHLHDLRNSLQVDVVSAPSADPDTQTGPSHASEHPYAIYVEGNDVRFRQPSFGVARNGIVHAAQQLIGNAGQLQVFAQQLNTLAQGLSQDAANLFELANNYGVDWKDSVVAPSDPTRKASGHRRDPSA